MRRGTEKKEGGRKDGVPFRRRGEKGREEGGNEETWRSA